LAYPLPDAREFYPVEQEPIHNRESAMSDNWVVRIPNSYRLSTSIGLTTLTLRFHATDDDDAAFIAMREILDRAAREQSFPESERFWSKGKIVLVDPQGLVLRTMLAKGVEA
jgi:hypothetical protein